MANRIGEWRKKRRYSLERLAALAGTTNQQVSRLERGERRLTDEWMRRLASALGVNPADLIGPSQLPTEKDTYPGHPSLDSQPEAMPRSDMPSGGEGHRPGSKMESELVHKLIEDVARLKDRVSKLEARGRAKTNSHNPTKARRSR